MDNIVGVFALIGMIYATLTIYIPQNKGHLLKVYFNSLLKLKLDNDHGEIAIRTKPAINSVTILDRLNILFIFILLLTTVAFPPLFVLGFHWANPCKPSLIGYFIISECYSNIKSYQWFSEEVISNVIVKFLVFAGNMWAWFTILCGCVFFYISMKILGLMMVLECMKDFWERFQNSTNL